MENSKLIYKLLSQEKATINNQTIEMFDYYSKVFDIIQRTYISMGRKNNYKIISSSTTNGKLNTNVFCSTY